ncbi:MAG: choice-of-anchor D domain-containing protein, partial [Acidobacteriaceae bacterium]
MLIIAASGCGTDFRADAQVAAAPSSVTWSKVTVGQTGGPKIATLTNSGNAIISISGIGFTGTNSGDFAIYQQTCGSTLAVSASCTVTILFKPTTSGTRTAALTFTDNASNSPQEVSLSGMGVSGSSGTTTATPSSLSFGSVGIGGSSASQTITVTNGTSASVALSGAGISGTNAADF